MKDFLDNAASKAKEAFDTVYKLTEDAVSAVNLQTKQVNSFRFRSCLTHVIRRSLCDIIAVKIPSFCIAEC